MNILSLEARNIQNPALGAALLWRFTCGFVKDHRHQDPVPFPLIFLVLPILLHEGTESFVKTTQKRSGLRAFAAKFGESKASKQDLLLAIHERMTTLKRLTIDSLRLALATRLLHLDSTSGSLIPLSRTQATAGMPDDTRQLMRDAEKIGTWCSELSIHEVATILKLRF